MNNYMTYVITMILLAVFVHQACAKQEAEQQATVVETKQEATDATMAANVLELTIDEDSFKCLSEMTAVRHFFVDNLLGEMDATVAVAESTEGGIYPPGSVVQLVPTEVMVKHRPGWNAVTRDWEFFELDVSAEGISIRNRGVADVVNRFGGYCFACHIRAEPKYDLICERDHGCDSIPITREEIAGVQAADPRCVD